MRECSSDGALAMREAQAVDCCVIRLESPETLDAEQ